MRISSIYPITMGKHSLSDELHRWGTGSSQRPLTESSSPWHPTPGRRCLMWKPKVFHLPSLPYRHSSICAMQICQHCIVAFFSSTCISHPQRSEGVCARWWNRSLDRESAVLSIPLPIMVRSPHCAQHCSSYAGGGCHLWAQHCQP